MDKLSYSNKYLQKTHRIQVKGIYVTPRLTAAFYCDSKRADSFLSFYIAEAEG